MDDDLLADDGQYKDDELDDLDGAEEAALLGLSDEELDSRDNEELEYVDEEGNPVEIGENNAELYEFANVKSGKRSASPADEDVLELDLDAEIDSFTQENSDLVRESPVKSYDRQHKENLISLTSRSEKSRISESPDRHSERLKMDSYSSSQVVSVRHSASESYNEPLPYEDESDNESNDDHRERFKSERSNIITLTPSNKRDIPDTLESVISVEENAKVQAFLEQEQQRKMRKGGRGRNRNQNYNNRHQSYQHQSSHHHHHQSNPHPHHQSSPHHQPAQHQRQSPHQHQNQHHMEEPPYVPHESRHQEPQAPPPTPVSPGRKILINPHFRGEVRLPIPATEPGMVVNQPPYDSKPPSAVAPYQQNPPYNPPPVYPQDPVMSVAPMVFNAPPPAMQYGQPEYHPQGLPPQNVPQPNAWQPQELGPPPTSYPNPPPVIMSYGDPIAQQPPPNYHGNFNPAYQPQVPYQNLNVPPPQPVYNPQPPVQVHMPPPAYNQPPVSSAMISPMGGPQEHHYPPPHSTPPQNMQKPYHEQRNNHNMPPPNQRNNNMQNQRFPRPSLDKRPSSANAKHVPAKMPRLENKNILERNKKNTHVNNSNIREIPLVDTSAANSNLVAKVSPAKLQGEVESSEYQKLLEKQRQQRAEVFKVKEQRRKQKAIRLQEELKRREMNKNNTNNISVQRMVQAPRGMNRGQVAPKGNVRERIGIPMAKTAGQGIVKKKVVVVRKKSQNNVPPPNNQPKLPVKQRVGLKPGQNAAVQGQKKIIRTNPNAPAANPAPQTPAAQPSAAAAPKAAAAATANPPPTQPPAKKGPATSPANSSNNNNKKQSPKQNNNRMQQRLGRRDFHRPPRMQGPPPGMPPRFNSPHPFMEPPMRFPPGMGPRPGMFNDHHHRPPLLCDRPPFMMDGPPPFRMPGFRGGFRGDAPPFPPHMPRPGMRFDRPRYEVPPRFQKNRLRTGSASCQRGGGSATGGSPGAGAKSPAARNVKGAGAGNQGPDISVMCVSESYSVSVEHISSSTNEASLKTMASTVGVVKELHVESDKKRAVITFAETSQAEAFQKKYQRLDNLIPYLMNLKLDSNRTH